MPTTSANQASKVEAQREHRCASATGSARRDTGLKDKNGKPIIEGDTVAVDLVGNRRFKIVRVKYYDKWRYSIHESIYWLSEVTAAHCEIVANKNLAAIQSEQEGARDDRKATPDANGEARLETCLSAGGVEPPNDQAHRPRK